MKFQSLKPSKSAKMISDLCQTSEAKLRTDEQSTEEAGRPQGARGEGGVMTMDLAKHECASLLFLGKDNAKLLTGINYRDFAQFSLTYT